VVVSLSFQAPAGTRDLLPPESARWEALVDCFARVAGQAGYGLVLTPLFEDVEVFARGVGESTDVVSREMYEFEDRGGRRMALRPEFTASLVRAFVQHRPTTPWKAWYWGPAFRYERPQAGRYRQFHQVGVEALGTEDPHLDVEVVALAWRFYRALGLAQLRLDLNSLGDGACRPAYRSVLMEYLGSRSGELCSEHRERWQLNPLRVLDCKKEECRALAAGAPRQLDHLCQACSEHWRAVLEGLQAIGIPYVVQPRLVRGLDYYTRTTFEVAAEGLGTAQDAVGGGGRYDGLVEALGGLPTPGIGFSLGIERILLACDAEGVFGAPGIGVAAFVVDLAGGLAALAITEELREAGMSADRAFGGRSLRAQLRAADRSGAAVALIIGPEEAAAGTVQMRWLRSDRGQEEVDRAKVVSRLREELG
jgi:histidyl-tRNA synthetase